MIYNPNSYKGGGMIKRADGSYSQRGLWDNIRANAGSGRKPTKEMLKQEKKIKAEKGGPILNQWDLPSDPSTPGYEDYGDMYTVPQWPGLMYKDPGVAKGWEGFGNPSNLQQSSWNNAQQSNALSAQPKQQLAMDASDYSIDNIRSQYMKNGGFSQKKGYFWNGRTMQKAVPGAYDGTVQYQSGGAVIPKGFQQIPIHQDMGRYGLNLYQNGGKVSQQSYTRGRNPNTIIGEGIYPTTYPGDTLTSNQIPYVAKYMYNTGQSSIPTSETTPQFQYFPSDKDYKKIDAFQKNMGILDKVKSSMGFYDGNSIPSVGYKQGGVVDVPIEQHMGRYGLLLYQQGGSVPPTYTAFQPNLNGMYAEGGIHIKPENRGKFGRWAANHNMGTQEAARHVMANKEDYSSGVVRMANFAKNAAGWKKQYGGSMYAVGGNFQPGEYEDPSTMPATAPPPVIDPLAPDPNDPNDPRNLDPQYAQQNAASRTGVVAPPSDPALSAQWRAGMTDEEAQQNLNNRPTTQQYAASMVPPMKPKRPYGTGYRNLLGAAMIYGQYAANQRQQKGLQPYGVQQGMTGMNPTRTSFSKGTYNQQGQIMGRYGGPMEYRTGGVYEVDETELEMLKMGGYKFKMI